MLLRLRNPILSDFFCRKVQNHSLFDRFTTETLWPNITNIWVLNFGNYKAVRIVRSLHANNDNTEISGSMRKDSNHLWCVRPLHGSAIGTAGRDLTIAVLVFGVHFHPSPTARTPVNEASAQSLLNDFGPRWPFRCEICLEAVSWNRVSEGPEDPCWDPWVFSSWEVDEACLYQFKKKPHRAAQKWRNSALEQNTLSKHVAPRYEWRKENL